MDNMRPGALAVLAGGVLLIISTFLDWTFTVSVWEGFFFGFQGFIMFVIGAAAAAVAGIRAFAPQVSLPNQVLGMSLNQIVFGLGVSVALLTFGLLFRDESAKIGTILALLAAVAIIVGSFMEENAEESGPARSI